MAQAVSNYAMWLAAQADALKAELEAAVVERDDAQADAAEFSVQLDEARQELATAKRELGHRREGHARPDFRKEQDRRTE